MLIVQAALGTLCQVLHLQATQWLDRPKTAVVACAEAVVTEVMQHSQAVADQLHSRIQQARFTVDQAVLV